MKLESIKIVNYKVFRNTRVESFPNMAVFLGMNGAGKTTFFDVFGFLHDALQTNIKAALAKRGGFKEVISRGQSGDIEFMLQFRPTEAEPLITYELKIGLDQGKTPVIKKEVMRFRRGQVGAPWKILEFSEGKGVAADGELSSYEEVRLAERTPQILDSPDILAIKGLGQFKEFSAVSTLRRLIEDWHVFDFHVDDARSVQEAGYSEHLSTTGDNLALVTKYIYDNHPSVFERILQKMTQRIPGISEVTADETADGRIVLRFQDGNFKDPFAARFVSDGTVKMFTFLVLLNDPERHALLSVEEPENQLYSLLFPELVDEFRLYAAQGGQVFVSTHSTDFIDLVELDELYCLIKKHGYTEIHRAIDMPRVKVLYREGDTLGQLWRQGLLPEGSE